MKKGVLGLIACSIQFVALSHGIITFNSSGVSLQPGLPDSTFSFGFTFNTTDPLSPVVTITAPDGSIFFPGSGGGGSSYFTGSGSGTLSPPNTPSDVRSRSFSGSDYFSSAGQMEDAGFALQLGNGVNPQIDSSGRMEIAPDQKVAGGDEPLVIQKGMVKAEGGFELSVKGPPQRSFKVQISTDGKTFSDLTQNASSGVLTVFHTCDEKGQCKVVDQEAKQSSFRFYRLQVLD